MLGTKRGTALIDNHLDGVDTVDAIFQSIGQGHTGGFRNNPTNVVFDPSEIELPLVNFALSPAISGCTFDQGDQFPQ